MCDKKGLTDALPPPTTPNPKPTLAGSTGSPFYLSCRSEYNLWGKALVDQEGCSSRGLLWQDLLQLGSPSEAGVARSRGRGGLPQTLGSMSVNQKRCGLENDSELGAEIVKSPRIHGVHGSSPRPAGLRASLRLFICSGGFRHVATFCQNLGSRDTIFHTVISSHAFQQISWESC